MWKLDSRISFLEVFPSLLLTSFRIVVVQKINGIDFAFPEFFYLKT